MPARRAGVAVGLLLFGTVIGCRTSEGQSVGGFNGSYRCFTTSMMQVGAAPNARDRNEREKRGMHELERGERAVPIAPQQQIMIMPAFFGNVVMDGRGGYRLTGSGHTGGYSVNRTTSAVTFTGDLKVMELRRISGRDAFFLVYQDLAFECGNSSGNSSNAGAAAGATPQGASAQATAAVGSAIVPTGRPSDFTGRFRGTFNCVGIVANPFRLRLDATNDGKLTGVYESGGDDGKAFESYAVNGTWNGTDFRLAPGAWIQQPKGNIAIGFTGSVNGNDLAGTMDHPRCGEFRVSRQ
jgi:hypothetical protein